jgi:hypothetical protein
MNAGDSTRDLGSNKVSEMKKTKILRAELFKRSSKLASRVRTLRSFLIGAYQMV